MKKSNPEDERTPTEKQSDHSAHSKTKHKISQIVYIVLSILLLNFASPPVALFLGIIFALTLGVPYPKFNKTTSKYLLQFSVVGLGFGMNLHSAIASGADGFTFTLFSVVSVMILGVLFGRLFRIPRRTSYLIASGTAICGGSAIAAVAPITKSNESVISISLATIFILNAVALFLFPVLGHLLNLTQQQFGVWAAIAIHDTSSVVGAGATYGEEALQIATTVKLTRALWIIPLTLFTTYYFKSKTGKVYIPWFILFFILAMVANTYLEIPQVITKNIVSIARQCLTLTLFFIGATLSRTALKTVGIKPLLLGITLWIFIGVISLIFVNVYY